MAVKHLRFGTRDASNRIFKVLDPPTRPVSVVIYAVNVITVVLQGNHHLEASFPFQHLAVIGGFVLYEPLFLPNGLFLDEKREHCGIRQVESGCKSSTTGEPIRHFPANPALSVPNCDPQLCGVVSGVIYLHELGVIHGDLKGVCLNSCNPRFRPADHASRQISLSTTTVPPSLRTSASQQFRSSSTRSLSPQLPFLLWGQSVGRAPNYCLGRTAHLLRSQIVMRLGWSSMRWVDRGYHDLPSFTCHQVLTGRRPFYHLGQYAVVIAILNGEHPRKPLNAESLGFSDRLWRLVVQCWDESPSVRPTTQDLFRYLRDAPPAWAHSLEYPIPDDPDGEADPVSLSRGGQAVAMGVLTGGFFALLIAVLCAFMVSSK